MKKIKHSDIPHLIVLGILTSLSSIITVYLLTRVIIEPESTPKILGIVATLMLLAIAISFAHGFYLVLIGKLPK